MRTLSASNSGGWLVVSIIFSLFVALAVVPQQASANPKYAGVVIDAKTGKTLYAHKADEKRYPASLTKMMTMYMMFDALDSGRMSKKTRIRVSQYAASKPPSKIGIKPGRTIAAEHAILALATKSANDVAAAVAEHLGGTESGFAQMMTQKARQLGMNSTTFKNASGLTANGQLTTARDMAKLGIALREHFPHHYHYFSRTNFQYGKANFRNHNRLLGRIKGVDGIKTGYTRASGYNLVSSVEANRRSIVAVVLGGRSGKSRNAQMQNLISKYLNKASRGSKKRLIAHRNGNTVLASNDIRLPKRGPLPVFRDRTPVRKTIEVSKPVVVASAAIAGSQIEKATLAERLGDPAVPTVRPTSEVAYIDPVKTASTSSPVSRMPAGWVVQIAATDSKSAAIDLLEAAQSKVPGVLDGKQLYTETVEKNGALLHRARFAGFSGKRDARNACEALKRKKISCLALSS